MILRSIEAGRFKLDGGAMFGVVPKRIWNKLNPSDDDNLCTWVMRSLLIETGDRKILVDTGIGFKQGAKFRSHFYPHGIEILDALAAQNVKPEEITDVFITHFHFDHVGGALYKDEKGKIKPTYPNATYWSNQAHYEYALEGNPREAASFLDENFVPLKEQGVLSFIDMQREDVEWMPGIHVRFVHGHTHAQMILLIDTDEGRVVYAADLFPSIWHIRLPYIMAYDMQPMVTLEEKERLLEECIDGNWRIFYEHDPFTEITGIAKDGAGRYVVKDLT